MKRDISSSIEARAAYRRFWGEIPRGWHVHHVNGDWRDNSPENLIAVPPDFHKACHTSTKRPFKFTPNRGVIKQVMRRTDLSQKLTGKQQRRIASRLLIQTALKEALRYYPKHKRLRSLGKKNRVLKPDECFDANNNVVKREQLVDPPQ